MAYEKKGYRTGPREEYGTVSGIAELPPVIRRAFWDDMTKHITAGLNDMLVKDRERASCRYSASKPGDRA